jgi:predicted alpha/beta hydrolase family esterase
MKKQVIVIGGGDVFGTYEEFIEFLKNFPATIDHFRPHRDWKSFLPERLGDKYDVLAPVMPNKQNAKFSEWKIWFEKLIPFIEDGALFVGHSLGGIFLVKYIAENNFPRRIDALFLVAAPYSKISEAGDFVLPENISKVGIAAEKIYLIYSKDDKIVPFSEGELYKKQLPQAEMVIFEDRGHFNQPEFPEILELIKKMK